MTVPTEALQLLLQNADVCHSVSRANTTVLQLMSASQAVQDMVEKHCSGSLCVTFSSKDASDPWWSTSRENREHREKSFGAWLLKHCHLLKSLHLDDIHQANHNFARSFLMPALRAAAASPTGLQLVSFSSETTENNTVELLQLLPASKLTHLGIHITNAAPEPGEGFEGMAVYSDDDEFEIEMMVHESYVSGLLFIRTEYDTPQMAATLLGFSKLTSLDIHGWETLLAKSPTMGALSQLTSLTKLSLGWVLEEEGLQKLQLPAAQLRELEVTRLNRPATKLMFRDDRPLPTLNWGHLTALTRLHTTGSYEGYNSCGVCVRQGDVLPPNLVTLCIGGCAALASLTSLPSLRQLSIASLEGIEGLPELPEAPTQPHGSRNTTDEPEAAGAAAQGLQLHSQAEQAAAAQLEQLQQRLPAVQIRVTKVWAVKDFNCFCCSGDSA